MAKGDKFIGLTRFLENCNEKVVTLSFTEIESAIGVELKPSAKKHREYWSNDKTHSIAVSWMNAGYRTIDVDLERELITFERG